MGRTRAKRLRGFGNAIVRPLAVAFMEAVIEAFVDAARSLGLHAIDVGPSSSLEAEVPSQQREAVEELSTEEVEESAA
jgi:hypothetical protein